MKAQQCSLILLAHLQSELCCLIDPGWAYSVTALLPLLVTCDLPLLLMPVLTVVEVLGTAIYLTTPNNEVQYLCLCDPWFSIM